MTPKEALNKLTEYIKLDEYDYETSGVGDAERLLGKALTELEELKRDVKRYIELIDLDDLITDEQIAEQLELHLKFQKVGVE